jgi:Rrf2 family nitric oxide-sensitive transcriptional repressor
MCYALAECFRPDGGVYTWIPQCRLKSRLAAARDAFLRELDSTTLAECSYPETPQHMPASVIT